MAGHLKKKGTWKTDRCLDLMLENAAAIRTVVFGCTHEKAKLLVISFCYRG